jgi:hypothetical protein
MNKVSIALLACLMALPAVCRGQFGGNVGYAQGGGKARAEQAEKAKRVLTDNDLPPTNTSMFVEASVLMNVKADEYVAVFGLATEGATVDVCSRAMDARVKSFGDGLKALGVGSDDLFVDFAAQNKVYGFEIDGNLAREKFVGLELKKNVSLRFTDKTLLDRIVAAAARAEVYDLIKVVYGFLTLQGYLAESVT